MATEILIKRSGSTSVPAELKQGELAYTWESSTGGKLYVGAGDVDANGFVLTPSIIGGKFYTDKMDHTPGALTANSVIIVDDNSKIDQLKVDTFVIDGNSITVANVEVTDLNVTLVPQGAGAVNVSTSKIINLSDPTLDSDAATKGYVDTLVEENASNFIEGEGIDISANTSTGEVVISAEYATTSNPGIASFNSTDFTVGGTGGVTVNAITLGSTALNPGETTTDLAGLTSLGVDNISINGNTISSTNTDGDITLNPNGLGAVSAVSATTIASGDSNTNVFEVLDSAGAGLFEVRQTGDAIIAGVLTVNGTGTSTFTGDVDIGGALQVENGATITAALQSDSMTVTGNLVVNGDIDLGNETTDSLSITARIDTDVIPLTNNSHSLGISGVEWSDIYTRDMHVGGTLFSDDITASNVTIAGNLIVEGTTTTVNTETINLADNIINLNSNLDANTVPSQDAGFEINRGSELPVSLVWDEAADKWTIGTETFVAATFEGDLTGNADTATALETARTISLDGDVVGSVSFDGTANVSITTTIQANSIVLGTDTTGDYLATLDVTAGTGIAISGNSGESAAVTISGINATNTVKGVASFGGWADSANTVRQFSVTSGDVAIAAIDGGEF